MGTNLFPYQEIQSDYTITGTLKEINDKVQSLSTDDIYLEPNNLQWKGISARVNNDLAELIQIHLK